MIKFNKYNVQKGKYKVRVRYSLDKRADNRKCVNIYAKDYGFELRDFFPENHQNDSNYLEDYHAKSRVVLFEDHPMYAVAREKVEALAAEPKSVVWRLV
mgnify:CR=1 FL=1